MTLRCYSCDEKFIVEEITFDKMNGLALVVPCPACGARPRIAPPRGAEPTRLHKLIELADESEKAPRVRVEVALKPQWYNRLAAWARPGTEAYACLENSRLRRKDFAYVVECDSDALAALADLAELSHCPEAIEAMREAYLAAVAAT